MPLWQGAEWDRPLSPTRRSRRYARHLYITPPSTAAHTARQQQQPTSPSSSWQAEPLPQSQPATDVATAHTVEPAHEQQAQQGSAGQAQQPELMGQAHGPLILSVHYVGLAMGELGVLSTKQVVQPRPVTAPHDARRPTSPNSPWRPTYSVVGPTLPRPASPGKPDLRQVVDDPEARTHTQPEGFTGRPLHPCRPKTAERILWTGTPAGDAPIASSAMTTHWRPRQLSAGGFQGWKMSRKGNMLINTPNIPPSLRQRPKQTYRPGTAGGVDPSKAYAPCPPPLISSRPSSVGPQK